MENYPKQMIADARGLFVKYRGRQHERIEREMQKKGWPFYRELLYPRKRSGGVEKGWPELYGWKSGKSVSNKVGKRELENWLKQTFPEWTWTWRYQRYLYERLNAVTEGKCKRLMIFMPPRNGKSETVTVRYTAWRLLRDPKLNVILGSYNQRLADRFSRKIKRICKSDAFRHSPARERGTPKGVTLTNASSEWETPAGGVVRSVGVGGGIAGFGAGLIVIDDPVRNRADAESQTFRDKVWDWFNDDIYTRLEPDASIILIQTRWHEDDLAGRLLKEAEDGGEKWEVVKLPALAEGESVLSLKGTEIIAQGKAESRNPGLDRNYEPDPEGVEQCGENLAPLQGARSSRTNPGVTLAKLTHPRLLSLSPSGTKDVLGRKPGEALCPKRFNVKALERIRKKLGSYSFSALYQQDPVPAEGGSFKREWFHNIIDSPPNGMRWKRGYDLAISTRTSADYTASFRCAFDKQGNLYIADGFRKRIEYPEQRRYIIDRMQNEPGTEHGIESAMHGKAVVQELRREPLIRRSAFREVRVNEDKLTRALSWLNLAEAGKVFLVRGPWIDEFIDEVCRFPSGRFDDQVDAVSIAVSMLSKRQEYFCGVSWN